LKSVEKQQLEIKQVHLGKQTNTKHGEEMYGEIGCLCTQMSGSNLVEGIWCG